MTKSTEAVMTTKVREAAITVFKNAVEHADKGTFKRIAEASGSDENSVANRLKSRCDTIDGNVTCILNMLCFGVDQHIDTWGNVGRELKLETKINDRARWSGLNNGEVKATKKVLKTIMWAVETEIAHERITPGDKKASFEHVFNMLRGANPGVEEQDDSEYDIAL